MTLKDRISQELLDSTGDPAALEEVLKRHNRSKGPLYLGLAQATTELCERLEFAFGLNGEAEAQNESLTSQVEALSRRQYELQETAQRLNHEVHQAETYLSDARGLIDRADELATAGFGEPELLRLAELMEAIPGDSAITVDHLAKSLAEYGSVEAVVDNRQDRATELKNEVSKLEAQVQTLTQEREAVHEAIVAVRDKALSEVQTVAKETKKQVDALVKEAVEVGKLRSEAADLGELIKSARFLRSGNPGQWQLLPRVIVRHLLVIVSHWLEGEGRDVKLTPPAAVTQGNTLLKYSPMRLSQLILWALNGLITEEERKSIVT